MWRVVLVLLVLQVTGSAPCPSLTCKVVEGQLAIMDFHTSGVQWAIRRDDGSLQLFVKDLKPPELDQNMRSLEPGTLVSMNCHQDANGLCTSATELDFFVKSAASNVNPVAFKSQRILAMIIDYAGCGYKATLKETDVRSIYLGDKEDGNGGVAEKYDTCSYGTFTINTTAFKALTVVPPCSFSAISSCSWYSYSYDTDSVASAALGADVFASFTNYVYILPPAMQPFCNWAGVALLPGKQVWLQTSSYGIHRWATVMQESIHNYGLWHSWQNGIEYNDYSTAMGRGNVCPNAAEISRMGWATPAPGGEALSTNDLTPGVAKTFTLPATYLTGDGNYLRVRPDWLPTYSTPSVGKNLYIAVRAPKKGDAELRGSYMNKVNVHEVDAMSDNGYPRSYVYYDRRITFINAVSSKTRADLTNYKLLVYGGNWVDTDVMHVHLCRYNSSANECPAAVIESASTRPPMPPLEPPPSGQSLNRQPPPSAFRRAPPSPRPPSRPPPSPRPPSRPPPNPRLPGSPPPKRSPPPKQPPPSPQPPPPKRSPPPNRSPPSPRPPPLKRSPPPVFRPSPIRRSPPSPRPPSPRPRSSPQTQGYTLISDDPNGAATLIA